jgi:type IV pilus assembly protein PilQ
MNAFTVTAAVTYPIELPNLTVREAATTLTIPDRGSVLIGGFGNVAEESTSSKIPFLGNIPYLGRLFGHRGRYSDHQKLYLMATITIISYDEQEAKL